MIQLQNVTKKYKEHTVLDSISMEIKDGELTVLIGPSGCGKTTTLKLLNKLIQPTSGEILIDGENIESTDDVRLRRNMGYVIQQGGLFPHMTIRENIEIIEKLEKKQPKEIENNTIRLMKMVDLNPDDYLDRYPPELSGGQLQRIGVIRALANDPSIVLLDEPFSALDPVTKRALQDELVELQSKMGKTMIFVTHDMDEAVKIADRVCIMRDGHILQFDTPEVIMKHPADDFVASFVGPNRIWSSPERIKVRDFMLQDPVTCGPELSRDKCADRMAENHIDTLLVVDGEKNLIGVIDKQMLSLVTDPAACAEKLMKEPDRAIYDDSSIIELLSMIQDKELNNIPVLNRENRLVGLLTNSILVSTLSRQYLPRHTGKEAAK